MPTEKGDLLCPNPRPVLFQWAGFRKTWLGCRGNGHSQGETRVPHVCPHLAAPSPCQVGVCGGRGDGGLWHEGNPWGTWPGWLSPPPPTHIPAAHFPRGGRIICFSCCPDLWATLFFIYLHKLSKVTRSFPEVRDPVNTSGSQVSRPAQGRRGYSRSPGNGP